MALDIDYEGIWHRAQHTRLNGGTILTLAPEDDLLILAIHGGKELWWNIKWACDIAAFIESHPKLDWTALVERAWVQGCGRMLLLATALACRCFGSAVPVAVAASECADATIEPTVARIVAHWQAELTGPPSKRMLALGRLRLHDGVVRRARYVARTLFSPKPDEVASIPLARALGLAYRSLKVAHNIVAPPLSNAYRHMFAQAERWQDALASSDFVLALIPASAERKLHQDARADAKRVLDSDPKNWVAWDTLGDALFGLKRYKKAIACYEQAIALVPEQSLIWTKRSAALEALGMRADLPVDTSNLQDASAWAVRASQLWALRRFEDAAKASDRALEVDPYDTAAAGIGIQSRLIVCDCSKHEEDKRRISEGLRRGLSITAPFAHRCMCDSETESLVLAQLWTGSASEAIVARGNLPARQDSHRLCLARSP